MAPVFWYDALWESGYRLLENSRDLAVSLPPNPIEVIDEAMFRRKLDVMKIALDRLSLDDFRQHLSNSTLRLHQHHLAPHLGDAVRLQVKPGLISPDTLVARRAGLCVYLSISNCKVCISCAVDRDRSKTTRNLFYNI